MIPQDIDDDHDDCESRWLTETLETLMKERAADEQKAESQKLKQVDFYIWNLDFYFENILLSFHKP